MKKQQTKKQKIAAAKKLLEPAKVWPEIGREYIVAKYWTGNFKGVVVAISPKGSIVTLRVTDAMRKSTAIFECPFPECVADMDHEGEHVFDDSLRNGKEVEVVFGNAQFLAAVFDQFQKREKTA